MNEILEKVMNFINENTMLLIFICIFLIIILVIYLIDNTIKTKRLEKEELKKQNAEPVILNNEIPEKVEKKPAAPVVEEVAAVATEPNFEDVSVNEPEVSVEEPEIPVTENEEIVVPEEPEIPVTPVAPVIDSNIDESLSYKLYKPSKIVVDIAYRKAL